MVRAAAVQFEATCRYFRNCHVTGVPVRREFFHVPPRPTDARPTLLVFGGSQGAHAINQAVLEALPKLSEAVPGHLHHSSDRREGLRRRAGGLSADDDFGRGVALHRRHAGAFARADLLLCRSGASTVAEITAAGKPAIFIPLPTAADDHQRQQRRGAGRGGRRAIAAAGGAHQRAAGDGDSALLRDRALWRDVGGGTQLCPSRCSR